MTRLHLLCTVGLVLPFLVYAPPMKIACVGDSITQGSGLNNAATESYPARLQRLLGTNSIVRNYGVSGRTLLKKGDFPYWKEPYFKQSHDWYPDIVIIQLGTNDSKPQNWRYATNFVSDYEDLVNSYSSLTNQPKIFVCTPCPVYANGAYDIRPGIVATNIAPQTRDLAGRFGLELIDLHTRLAGHSEWFPDTVHPNSKGMVAMAAVIFSDLTGGPPAEDPPPLTIRRVLTSRVEVSWPARWGGLIPQLAGTLKSTNTVWTVFDTAIPYGDETWIRLTNGSAGAPKFFRLWQP
jgi:acyl-CoA thioesterase I